MERHSRSRSRSPARRSRNRRSPTFTPSPKRRRHHKSRSRSPQRRRSRSRSASLDRRQRDLRDTPEPCKTLGVFGLSYSTTEGELHEIFAEFGHVARVDLVRDPRGDSRGFGFILFEHLDDAVEARNEMTDTTLHGRRIRVDFSFTKGPHPKTPGQGYQGYQRRSRYRSPPRRRYRYSH